MLAQKQLEDILRVKDSLTSHPLKTDGFYGLLYKTKNKFDKYCEKYNMISKEIEQIETEFHFKYEIFFS